MKHGGAFFNVGDAVQGQNCTTCNETWRQIRKDLGYLFQIRPPTFPVWIVVQNNFGLGALYDYEML